MIASPSLPKYPGSHAGNHRYHASALAVRPLGITVADDISIKPVGIIVRNQLSPEHFSATLSLNALLAVLNTRGAMIFTVKAPPTMVTTKVQIIPLLEFQGNDDRHGC